MGKRETRPPRRELLKAGLSLPVLGLSGCLRMGGGGETSTPGSEPTAAEFEFAYQEEQRRVVIRYTGGGIVEVGKLQIRASNSATAYWYELGSTAVTQDETLETGSTAIIGDNILNWDSNIRSSETVRIVYQLSDESPTTLARFTPNTATQTPTPNTATRTPTDPATSTATPGGASPTPRRGTGRFHDDFEDGDFEGWSPLKLPNPKRDGNDWSLEGEDPISGEYSLRVDTTGNESENAIATDDYVIDMSSDFDLFVKWRTPDPNNRGLNIRLLELSGTNFEGHDGDVLADDVINVNPDGDAISKEGSPFSGGGEFCGEDWDFPSTPAGETHSITVEKRDTSATLFLDEEEQLSGTVAPNGTYRLVFLSSGTWGSSSVMIIDDVTTTYL